MYADQKVSLHLYELGLVAATRGLLGMGIGLLLGEHLEPRQRHILGTTLIAVGALSTIPLGYDVLSKAGILGHNTHEPDFSRLSSFASRANGR